MEAAVSFLLSSFSHDSEEEEEEEEEDDFGHLLESMGRLVICFNVRPSVFAVCLRCHIGCINLGLFVEEKL